MHAEFFTPDPRPVEGAPSSKRASLELRLRQVHRWASALFTLTVAANFAAMTRGQPPAWITYAPLPPLLFLTITGLYMLTRHVRRSRRATRSLSVTR